MERCVNQKIPIMGILPFWLVEPSDPMDDARYDSDRENANAGNGPKPITIYKISYNASQPCKRQDRIYKVSYRAIGFHLASTLKAFDGALNGAHGLVFQVVGHVSEEQIKRDFVLARVNI